MKKLLALSLFAVVLCAEEKTDLAVIQRIKKEAFQNSKVMDHLFWLSDVYGPRLTGSPGFTAAANWAVKRLKEYGIEDAAAHPWGKFGRSWRLTKFSISLQEPEYAPLIGFPLAWSANTNGPLVAEPVEHLHCRRVAHAVHQHEEQSTVLAALEELVQVIAHA